MYGCLGGSQVVHCTAVCLCCIYRVLTLLIACMLLRNWDELEIQDGDPTQPRRIVAALASSTQGTPPYTCAHKHRRRYAHNKHVCYILADPENGFSYMKNIMPVLCDRKDVFWELFFKEQFVQFLDMLLSPPKYVACTHAD